MTKQALDNEEPDLDNMDRDPTPQDQDTHLESRDGVANSNDQSRATKRAGNADQQAQTLNEAFKMNNSQPEPETNRKGVATSKSSKNRQGKNDDKTYTAPSSRSKSDQNPKTVPTIKPPKHKNEVIDLTLEEVSWSILFTPVFCKIKIYTRFPSLNHAFSRFPPKRCCGNIILQR
jgi:hypothetical protein